MNSEVSSRSSVVVTQTQDQRAVATSISFSTPECSPCESNRSTTFASTGVNKKNSSIIKEEVSKITPPDKVKPLKNTGDGTSDMKSTPSGNGAETSFHNHLGGSNNEPIAAATRGLSNSVQESVTQHACRQTKGRSVSRRGGRYGVPSPARLGPSPPLDITTSGNYSRNICIKDEDTFLFQHSSILPKEEPGNTDNHNTSVFSLSSRSAADLDREALTKLEEYAEVSIKSEPDTGCLTNVMNIDMKGARSSLSRLAAPTDRNVTFSPVPTHTARTPIRSPSRQHYTDLPNLDITKIESPGIFLSPHLSSIQPLHNEQQKCITETTGMNHNMRPGGVTPTNFASADFGKGEFSLTSFDGNNVLPWLSPTSYHLFSPGVMATTPRGMFGGIPRTPRTPTTNPLFFSDPDDHNNNSEVGTKKTSGSSLNDAMQICVSPLAPSKRNSANSAISKNEYQRGLVEAGCLDINFKDVFASPKADVRSALRVDKTLEMPTPTDKKRHNGSTTKLSLEKHMAERDLMEDEDIRLLLQLAQTTPRKNCHTGSTGNEQKSNTRVFRSPRQKAKTGLRHPSQPGEPLISLQLPFMGRNGRDPSTPKLSRKTSRERPQMHTDDFKPHLVLGSNPSSNTCIRKPGLSVADNLKKNSTRPLVKMITKNKLKLNQSQKLPINALGMAKNMATLQSIQRPAPAPGIYSAPVHPQYGNPSLPAIHQAPPHGVYPPRPHIHMHRPGMPGHVPFHYPYPTGPPPHPYSYISAPAVPGGVKLGKNSMKKGKINGKRPLTIAGTPMNKKMKKPPSGKARGSGSKKCHKNSVSPAMNNPAERQKTAAAIAAMNAAAGHKNDKAAALASAIMRGVTMRPSGKWQAQLYYAGKSRYIGVFDTREKAALAYEIAREKLKTDKSPSDQSAQSVKETEANVNAARKAAFEGVNEKDPRITGK